LRTTHTHNIHHALAFTRKSLEYNGQDTVMNHAVPKKSSGPLRVRWPHPDNVSKRDRPFVRLRPELKEWLVAHGLDAGAMAVRALRTGGHIVQRRQRLPRLEQGRHNRVRVRMATVVVVRDVHVRRRHVNGLWRRLMVIVVVVVAVIDRRVRRTSRVLVPVVAVIVAAVAAVVNRRVRRTSRVLVVVAVAAVINCRRVRRASRGVRRAGGRRRRHRVARPLGIAHDLKVVARLTTVAGHVPERTARTLVGRRGLADAGRLFRPTLRAGAARGRRGRPVRR
jgi:hypothetical protein